MALFRQSEVRPFVARRFAPSRRAGVLTFTDFASNANAPQTSKSALVHVYDVTGVSEILSTSITTDSGADASIISSLLVAGTTYRGWGIDASDGAMFVFSLVAT